ncbi:MAG: glycosyltransferase [Candidatus Omnitrophica bacterium]|nr:glycosyltransferase [Candidatus Omnitrophota bacterium]MBU1869145.1 glycosyltransferase [Candidatus Omnitrophota bacterium]
MKVLFFTLYPGFAPSSRFRVNQFTGYLEDSGIECTVLSSIAFRDYLRYYGSKNKAKRIYLQASEFFNRVKQILEAGKFDIVFLQKGILSVSLAGMDKLLFSLCKNVVFDFDDAVYLFSPQQIPGWCSFLEDKNQIAKIIKMSKAVIAGNKHLADAVSGLNDKINIVPTSVDTDFFRPAENNTNNDGITIFWSGNRSGNYLLKDVSRVISKLASKYKIKFVIQSDSADFIDFASFSPAEIIFKKWDKEEELSNFQNADIGIMPMHDSEWERGKCAFKALLYMSVGFSVVSSPVGLIKDIVRDGENGYLAGSEAEWEDKLIRLIEDKNKRNEFGVRGRKLVEEHYSLKVNAPKLKRILEEVAAA